MLSIPCPFCGPRDEIEFVCGGEDHIVRPEPPQSVSDAQWADYLFFRRNERGVTGERWLHRHGCGQWFIVTRDTVTHLIGPARE
jgi:sarcosine oxidase subunit delta